LVCSGVPSHWVSILMLLFFALCVTKQSHCNTSKLQCH
jgi:hypothetical protein